MSNLPRQRAHKRSISNPQPSEKTAPLLFDGPLLQYIPTISAIRGKLHCYVQRMLEGMDHACNTAKKKNLLWPVGGVRMFLRPHVVKPRPNYLGFPRSFFHRVF
jgi:hypothetical protein